MWHHDIMDIIKKEFYFIEFEERDIQVDPLWTSYFCRGNGAVINIGYEIICVIIINHNNRPYKVEMISKEEDVIKELYEYLPKEFYLPYQRDKTIDNILK